MKKQKKIKKILIPNRGEIAVRIQRTCRELGIQTVSVFSEPDRYALHVRYAWEAYPLEGSTPQETYLNQDKIFQIAKKSGADAIHPGYGFLSENAEFVENCQKHKLTFIGPKTEAIQLMGLKTEARARMIKAGVPVVPGTDPIDDPNTAQKEADKIGYPVLVKASAGGGGKGMRVVERSSQLKSAFEACRREALSAFGDDKVYIEKYLKNPRHIEFQILADTHGNCLHLFERECSVQRRHQKIIEETPSPVLDDSLREKMGNVAVEAARACGYVNAGTVEFLVDNERNFYFLEMNTRLQVEHPITELITGVDLVEQQIRIAEGEALNIKAHAPRGAAMECRIYAEDPTNNFLPSPGKIKALNNPGGPGVRNDSGVYGGYTIPSEYDPMISKLVVWGGNRPQVLRRMERALEEYYLLGVHTNIPYLRKIIKHPQFISGDYDTHFIDQHQNDLLVTSDSSDESVALAAAAIITYTKKSENQAQCQKPEQSSAWKLYDRMRRVPR